ILPVGTFEMAFSDNAESGFSQWISGGSSALWNTTTSAFQSPTHSFTDSPGGNYPNSANYWMRSSSIDLIQATTAELNFWTKWDIEADWDFAVIEISNNGGSSWNHLIGQYMSSASGIGTQTAGLHGYDGQQNQWVEESIDLSAYCGQTIILRYRMTTDGSVTGDGWYVDDVHIRTLGQTTNIPPYIATATALNNQTFSGASYGVDAIILDDSGIDSVSLYYSTDNGQSYQEIPMNGSDSLFHTAIPPLNPGLNVKYYLIAWDNMGAFSYYPFNAPGNTLNLMISGSGPVLVVEPASANITVSQLSSFIQPFKIFNPGTDPVSYSITDSTIQSIQNLPTVTDGGNLQDYIISYLRSMVKNIGSTSVPSFKVPSDYNSTAADQFAVIISDSTGDTGLPGVDILEVDFSETGFNYQINLTFAGPPDSNSIAVVSFDRDQNFGTGAYPAPLGYGLGNHDIGSEYDVVFDFANFIGDSLGLPPSGYVLNVQDSTPILVGLPLPLNINSNNASLTLYKLIFPALFDNTMNITATSLHLLGQSVPDMGPDFGHGNLGGELGCSWLTTYDSNGISGSPITGIINPGDSVLMNLRVAAAYPLGIYQAVIKISNNGPFSPLEMPVTMTIALPGIAQISIDPPAISDTVEVGTGVLSRDLSIINNGTGTLYFTLTDTTLVGQNWLTFNPMLGAVQPGASQTIDVQIDPANLSANNLYDAELRVFSNDPLSPEIVVPVSIFVTSPNVLQMPELIPRELNLYSNFPNPFNPSTTLTFDLPQTSPVSLEIYNILGQKIVTLVDQKLSAGTHTCVWNGTNSLGELISAGIYFYKLETPDKTLIRKMILTK
ncbi:MAG: immune inhibitor A, partial [bacterium]